MNFPCFFLSFDSWRKLVLYYNTIDSGDETPTKTDTNNKRIRYWGERLHEMTIITFARQEEEDYDGMWRRKEKKWSWERSRWWWWRQRKEERKKRERGEKEQERGVHDEGDQIKVMFEREKRDSNARENLQMDSRKTNVHFIQDRKRCVWKREIV